MMSILEGEGGREEQNDEHTGGRGGEGGAKW